MHLNPHFPIQPSWGNINHDKKDVKDKRKPLMVGQNASKAAEMIQNAGKRKEMMKYPVLVLAPLCYQEVEMGVEIDLLSKCLDRGHNTRTKLYLSRHGKECLCLGRWGSCCLKAKQPNDH